MSSAGSNRRYSLLLATAALAGVVLLAAACGSGNGSSSATGGSCRRNYLEASDLSPARLFTDPLPIPNRLQPQYTKSDGTPVWVVHARAYTWRPAPGVCISKWGFEGTTPGPTLVVKPYERSELLVYNELPQSLYNPYVDPFNQLNWVNPISPIRTYYTAFGAPPTRPPAPFNAPPYAQSQYELSPDITIHLHGGHQTPANDGYPMDTFGPGQSHLYDYPNNQEATTLWYHDHAMDHTRGHVLMGLAGFYFIEDVTADAKLGLPTGHDCQSLPAVRSTRREVAAVLADAGSRRRRSPRCRPPATTSRSCSSRCRPRCCTARSFNPPSAGHAQARAPTVPGGLDRQRHAGAVPDGDEQAVSLPLPQRQRRGAAEDLDDHEAGRPDELPAGRLPPAGRHRRWPHELRERRSAEPPADEDPAVPGPARRRRHRLLEGQDEDDVLPAGPAAAGVRRRHEAELPDPALRLRRRRRPDTEAAHRVRRRPDDHEPADLRPARRDAARSRTVLQCRSRSCPRRPRPAHR